MPCCHWIMGQLAEMHEVVPCKAGSIAASPGRTISRCPAMPNRIGWRGGSVIPGVCLASLDSSSTSHICVPRVRNIAAFHRRTSSLGRSRVKVTVRTARLMGERACECTSRSSTAGNWGVPPRLLLSPLWVYVRTPAYPVSSWDDLQGQDVLGCRTKLGWTKMS